jgi:SpoVK/Ycf46/Vps4 family AAA+-type ATPase
LSLDLKQHLGHFPGHAEMRLNQIFRKASRTSKRPPPVLIFFENLDTFRELDHHGCPSFNLPHRLISIFLRQTKELSQNGTAIVLGTCQEPWKLHKALLDEVELHIPIGLPDLGARRNFLEKQGAGITKDEKRILVQITEGRNFTELADFAEMVKGKTEAMMRQLVMTKQMAIKKNTLDLFKEFYHKYRN